MVDFVEATNNTGDYRPRHIHGALYRDKGTKIVNG